MHVNVLVVGEVAPQMEALKAAGWCDWWTIGGRFAGRLPLKPGCTGTRFGGEAFVPPFERMLRGDFGAQLGTGGTGGAGADQARKGDVDLGEIGAGALVIDGAAIACTASPEIKAVPLAIRIGAPVSDDDLERFKAEAAAWDDEIRAPTGRGAGRCGADDRRRAPMTRRLVAAVLALLAGCAPAHDSEWARSYLEKDPLGPRAGEAFRALWSAKAETAARAPVLPISSTEAY